jgi:RNA polymerase sigma-70 factor (ECF subfamily)
VRDQELIPHLFRNEFTKIVSVLTRSLGIDHLGLAEDIASDTFLAATETWPYKGIPANPTAWLYAVARNKAINQLHRQQIFENKISPALISKSSLQGESGIEWSDQNMLDSQLQMIFVICHPSISIESQLGLALRILCGMGIEEIANALLTNKETINKRLYRAKETLREKKIALELPSLTEINHRLATVLKVIYLLFNEGYYSESDDAILKKELCHDAMRLCHLLIRYERTNTPTVNALLSLMYFHASRFPARVDGNGEMILYQDQDESLWDQQLIAQGVQFLHKASQGNTLSTYHLEASIAYWHTIKTDTPEKWGNILNLYNHLLSIEYSPVAALNRTYALSKVKGNELALLETQKLDLKDNHYYYILMGELIKSKDPAKAQEYYRKAWDLAKSNSDKRSILKKLNASPDRDKI